MPLTFFSHQAPVLPLKIIAPRWFDGTALVTGSMAPDLFFVTQGTDWYVDAHGSWAGFAACLPLTLLLTWIINRVIAGPLGSNLPDLGSFHLREYARLEGWRWPSAPRGWVVLLWSALLGAFSHVLIDSFTHGFGWVVRNVDALEAEAFVLPESLTGRIVYVHDFLQIGGTVIGAAITVWCLHYIGRRRLLVRWYPDEPVSEATIECRRLLGIWTAAGLSVGVAAAGLAAHVGGAQDFIIRVAGVTFVGLLAGCVHVRRSADWRSPARLGDVGSERARGRAGGT